MGRPPIGKTAMTSAERVRRHRERAFQRVTKQPTVTKLPYGPVDRQIRCTLTPKQQKTLQGNIDQLYAEGLAGPAIAPSNVLRAVWQLECLLTTLGLCPPNPRTKDLKAYAKKVAAEKAKGFGDYIARQELECAALGLTIPQYRTKLQSLGLNPTGGLRGIAPQKHQAEVDRLRKTVEDYRLRNQGLGD
jgi:hypothetical protein